LNYEKPGSQKSHATVPAINKNNNTLTRLTLIGLTLTGLTLIGLTLTGLTLTGLTLIGLTLTGLTLTGLTLTGLTLTGLENLVLQSLFYIYIHVHGVLAVSHCVDTVSPQCHTARTWCPRSVTLRGHGVPAVSHCEDISIRFFWFKKIPLALVYTILLKCKLL